MGSVFVGVRGHFNEFVVGMVTVYKHKPMWPLCCKSLEFVFIL